MDRLHVWSSFTELYFSNLLYNYIVFFTLDIFRNFWKEGELREKNKSQKLKKTNFTSANFFAAKANKGGESDIIRCGTANGWPGMSEWERVEGEGAPYPKRCHEIQTQACKILWFFYVFLRIVSRILAYEGRLTLLLSPNTHPFSSSLKY